MIANFLKRSSDRNAPSLRPPSLATPMGVGAMAAGGAMIAVATSPKIGVGATVVGAQATWFFAAFEAFAQRSRARRMLRVGGFTVVAVAVAALNWALTRQGVAPGIRIGMALAALAVGAMTAARAVSMTNHLLRQAAHVKARLSPDRTVDLDQTVEQVAIVEVPVAVAAPVTIDLSEETPVDEHSIVAEHSIAVERSIDLTDASPADDDALVLDLATATNEVQSEVTVGDLTIIGMTADDANEDADIARHNERVLS